MKKLRPMRQPPETPTIKIVQDRTRDSTLLLEFLEWYRLNVVVDGDGNWLVFQEGSKLAGAPLVIDACRDGHDLIARFYGTTSDLIAADRRAIEEYRLDKLHWFSEARRGREAAKKGAGGAGPDS